MGRENDILKAARDNQTGKLVSLLEGKPKRTLSITRRNSKGKLSAAQLGLSRDADGRLKVVTTEAPIDTRDESGATPLILAALGGHVEAVEVLISRGANINAKDTQGNTALHMAAWQERENSSQVVEILLNQGADANATNVSGHTPLHNAAQNGQTFVVMLLVDHGADAHVANNEGDTPLDIAARYNREEVVSFLLDHDNTVVKATKALREAARAGRAKLVRTLLDMGMDVNAEDPQTRSTALHEAMTFCRLQAVETLLAFGADAYQPNEAGDTPESIAKAISSASDRTKLLKLIEEYKDKDVQVPAVVLNERRQRKAQEALKYDDGINDYLTGKARHPPLRCLTRWLEDTQEYRSGAFTDNPVTNVLSDDASSSWATPGSSRVWAAFNFPHHYTITAITVIGRPDRQLPRECQLEVAESLSGPWRSIKAFSLSIGDDVTRDPVTGLVTQTFDGFHATSQYWRLHILRNHGAEKTSLNGIRFFGVDAFLAKWFAENGLTQYYRSFVDAGFNQLLEMPNVTNLDLDKLVELPGQRRKFELAIRTLVGNAVDLETLAFSRPPPQQWRLGSKMPLMEVQANPGADKEVELIVHGGASIAGTTRRRLLPNGVNPSVAFFDDIVVMAPGNYLFEVRSCQKPQTVYVKAPHTTRVEPPPKPRTAMEVLFADYSPMLNF